MNLKRALLSLLVFFAPWGSLLAQQPEVILPAGTLLHCTLSEPNFSPATAEIGDPVVCDVDSIQRFGRTLPRGTYLVGHLVDAREPGHFFGKGSMSLSFDRIGMPNSDLPLPGKIIAVSKQRVNREGTIIGHGHARRDVVEWLLPPLWPWKVLALPARGPEPALKGEVRITVRMMQDLVPASPVLAPHAASYSSNLPIVADAQRAPIVTKASVSPGRTSGFTLLAVRPSSVYIVSDYWLQDDLRLAYVLTTGAQQSIDLSQLDWDMTTRLNADRGVRVVLQDGGPRSVDDGSHAY
jgi:hypothetical protein